MKEKNNQPPLNTFHEIGNISSPDDRFRVALGSEVKEFLYNKGLQIDGFKVFVSEEGDILLKPIAQIPSSELWLYQDKDKIGALRKGVKDIEQGKLSKPIKTAKQLDNFLDSL